MVIKKEGVLITNKIKIINRGGYDTCGYYYNGGRWMGYSIIKYGEDISKVLAELSFKNNNKRYKNYYKIYNDTIVLYVYSNYDKITYRCLFDLEDIDLVEKTKWYIQRGNSHTPYLVSDNLGTAHKNVISNMSIDRPKGYVIDHINFNGLDNRRKNLRVVDNSVNKRNTQYYINSGALPLGVTFENSKYPRYKVKWCTDIYDENKKMYKCKTKSFTISHYNSKEEALEQAILFNEEIRKVYY